jgi:hypothetical protein
MAEEGLSAEEKDFGLKSQKLLLLYTYVKTRTQPPFYNKANRAGKGEKRIGMNIDRIKSE